MKTLLLKQCASVILLIFLTTLFSTAFSAQRALLIGVGEYQIPNKNLPGIDVDIELMKDALARLGFAENEIKILHDQTATYQNIKDSATSWLVDGVSKQDRVVLYFGGHGSRMYDASGDEADNIDEVLMPHDAKYVNNEYGRTLNNVVVDDELASWLANIPSDNVLVLVDACNSGTITRSIDLNNRSLGVEIAYPKLFTYEGMPENSGMSFTRALSNSSFNRSNNYISISAAQDDEFALTTSRGSYFTLGIVDAIKRASKDMNSITVEKLHEHADKFIEKKVSKDRRYHPQIHGNQQLAKGEYELFKITQGYGPKWKSLEKLSKQGKFLPLSLNKKDFQLGDNVSVTINISQKGYLNIVSIDAYDQATILFPNKYNLDNYVKPSTLSIPTKEMPFTLPAVEPTGPTMVAAFLTEKPINLYELSHEGRNIEGMLNETFATLSYTGIRAISLVNSKNTKSRNTIYGHSVVTRINFN